MTQEMKKWREVMADRARQVMSLLGDVADAAERLNALEKTVSRLKDGLTEEYKKVDDILDRES